MTSNILPFSHFCVEKYFTLFRASRCTGEINFLTLVSKTSFVLHDLVLYGFSLESFSFFMAQNILPFSHWCFMASLYNHHFLWRQICTGEINFLTLVSKRSFVLHDLVLYGSSLESFSFFMAQNILPFSHWCFMASL
jgi:hypothetical protein